MRPRVLPIVEREDVPHAGRDGLPFFTSLLHRQAYGLAVPPEPAPAAGGVRVRRVLARSTARHRRALEQTQTGRIVFAHLNGGPEKPAR